MTASVVANHAIAIGQRMNITVPHLKARHETVTHHDDRTVFWPIHLIGYLDLVGVNVIFHARVSQKILF
jgi:hypothetical protein